MFYSLARATYFSSVVLAKDRYNVSGLPIDVNSAEIPIDYQPPIYGIDSETFLDFVAPGIMCSIIYFLAVGLTTLSFVLERKVCSPDLVVCSDLDLLLFCDNTWDTAHIPHLFLRYYTLKFVPSYFRYSNDEKLRVLFYNIITPS